MIYLTNHRTISLFRTTYSFVAVSRSNRPSELSLLWFSLHAPDTAPYTPIYVNSETLPPSWIRGTMHVSSLHMIDCINWSNPRIRSGFGRNDSMGGEGCTPPPSPHALSLLLCNHLYILIQKYDPTTAWWNFCAVDNYASRFYVFAIKSIREAQRVTFTSAMNAVKALEEKILSGQIPSGTYPILVAFRLQFNVLSGQYRAPI